MNIYPHNYNHTSNSGPNKFTRTLFNSLEKHKKVRVVYEQHKADVEFCLIQQHVKKVKPMILRLDGIWFNSDQDYERQNQVIRYSYDNAEAVVMQSEFDKKLVEAWFGKHRNLHVIHNAADLDLIKAANPNHWDKKFGKDVEVWSCAASWRPHKRLDENIRYFLEFAPKESVLAIAGFLGDDLARLVPNNKRIVVVGDLDYMSLLSLYKRSTTFIHLAYLDHCPNVVVDAQAAGCKIVCSSSGGTSEIVSNGVIIREKEWNFKPTKLYNPPEIDFSKRYKKIENKEENKPSIVNCSERYYKLMKEIM